MAAIKAFQISIESGRSEKKQPCLCLRLKHSPSICLSVLSKVYIYNIYSPGNIKETVLSCSKISS